MIKTPFYFTFQEIFAETEEKLQETIAQKEKTQRALDCTRTVLHKTEGERAEQVSNHYLTGPSRVQVIGTLEFLINVLFGINV